ncbi:MAG: DinB family protein [Planctomycetota bacterium]
MAARTIQGELYARGIEQGVELFERFLPGFDDANRTAQAEHLPNHMAWTLGHVAMTSARAIERLQGQDAPQPLLDHEFVVADRGDAERFGTEVVCFGSNPVDDPAIYPSLARSAAIFRAVHGRLAGALREADDAALARPTPWGSGRTTVGDLMHRMAFHIGTHTGQIVDLRRALGIPPVIAPRS